MCFNRVKNARDTAFQLIDDGVISEKELAAMCISWMSDDDVGEMLRANDYLPEERSKDDSEEPADDEDGE